MPTCSQYSIDSYKKYGAWKGTVLTAWRLLRCNPWSEALLGGRGLLLALPAAAAVQAHSTRKPLRHLFLLTHVAPSFLPPPLSLTPSSPHSLTPSPPHLLAPSPLLTPQAALATTPPPGRPWAWARCLRCPSANTSPSSPGRRCLCASATRCCSSDLSRLTQVPPSPRCTCSTPRLPTCAPLPPNCAAVAAAAAAASAALCKRVTPSGPRLPPPVGLH